MNANYKIKSEENQQLVFEYQNQAKVIIVVIAFFSFLIVLFISIDLFNGKSITEIQGGIFGLSIVFLVFIPLGFYINKDLSKYPNYIIFNNETGTVQVKPKSINDEAYLEFSYNVIFGFTKDKIVETSKNEKTGAITSSIKYLVSILKNDGFQWDLAYFRNEAEAIELIAKLEHWIKDVKSPANSKSQSNQELPKGIEMIDSEQEIVLSWKNKITFFYVPLFIILLAIFVFTFFVFQWEGWDSIGFIFMAFLFFVLGMVFIRKVYKNLATKHFIKITSDNLTKMENQKVINEIPLVSIASIGCDFDLGGTGSHIKVIDHDLYEKIRQRMTGGKSESAGLSIPKSFTRKMIVLEIDELDLVGKFHLEQFLESHILKKGGVDVL